ncbi:hypothetical protein [Sphingobacterium yanglingense]|uniref:hypothetical protein n=1 Tax=Sphingobacterium yanglingense TaxID=1437280 RepID=UPI00105C84F3|nr:hypothetical protein [Sphingobacterium yanglingense]
MKEQDQHIKRLFRKYLDGSYTTEDLEQLLSYFKADDPKLLKQLIYWQFDEYMSTQVDGVEVQKIVEENHRAIMQGIVPKRRSFRLWRTISAASIVLVTLGLSLYWYTGREAVDTPLLTSDFGG